MAFVAAPATTAISPQVGSKPMTSPVPIKITPFIAAPHIYPASSGGGTRGYAS